MLNPKARSLYTSVLTPPPGMAFDEAVATTFSMDPGLLLAIPVHLALLPTRDANGPDVLAMLKSIRRYAERITVYVQHGRIHVPQVIKASPLFGKLEDMIVEAAAPEGGVFHPKVWAVRFLDADSSALYRLVVLTRNMTADNSWDLSLQIEGRASGGIREGNRPLWQFFNQLPEFARAPKPSRTEQTLRFADELRRVEWELPRGFEELSFHPLGIKGGGWTPPKARRLAVISPFCSNDALQHLANTAESAAVLISRPETLAALSEETRARFGKCMQLTDMAETDDGEATDRAAHPLATGLHAKAYIYETRRYSEFTHVVVGSANATNAVMRANKNIEFLVELTGKKKQVGGIDDLVGEKGIQPYLEAFVPEAVPEADTRRREAERRLEAARSLLIGADLTVACRPTEERGLWAMLLKGKTPALGEGIVASAWPITVSRQLAVPLGESAPRNQRPLGRFGASTLTGLIAFELKEDSEGMAFVLNLPITGLPKERNAAIAQAIIQNEKQFLRYLHLLLNDTASTPSGPGQGVGSGGWLQRLAVGDDAGLLEELVRALGRHPETLRDISALIRDMNTPRKTQATVIPKDFLELWSVFEKALEK